MAVYDFRCDLGHMTERRGVGSGLQAILCPECGKVAPRVAVYQSQYILGATVAKAVGHATN